MVKLFLKQGISHQLGRDAVVRFECENSAIDVIINFLWKIFHKPIDLRTCGFDHPLNWTFYHARHRRTKNNVPSITLLSNQINKVYWFVSKQKLFKRSWNCHLKRNTGQGAPGTGPLWNPCLMVSEIRGQRKKHPKCFLWFPYEVPFCICFEIFLSIDDFCWTINVFSKNCEGISTFWLQLFSTAPCPVFLFKWQFQLLLNSFFN
jgi:hypothetical protein